MNTCTVCGTPIAASRKYCKNGHKITAYRRRVQRGAKGAKQALDVVRQTTPVKSPEASQNAKKGASAFNDSEWMRKSTAQIKSLSARWGDVYEGTMLRKRWLGTGKNAKALAPVYMDVDTLSLPERQARAFEMADRYKLFEVVVDGVLSPKPLDGWHVWRSSDELLDYVLREKKLPEGEIRFRLALRQLERARHDLDFVFHLTPPQPEHWQESLRFQQQMLDTARKGSDKAHIAKLERRVNALERAINAQVAVDNHARYNEKEKEPTWQNEAICTTK